MTLQNAFDQLPLPTTFYDRPAVDVAQTLLGKLLCRQSPGGLTVGRIMEAEAYLASGDPACHSARGQTRRNASMFGAPGRAYVYAIHSRWCFNVVTEPIDVASAVLIRAVEPLMGLELMRRRRGLEKLTDLTRGPARLCESFEIDRRLDGWDLTRGRRLWIAGHEDDRIAAADIGCSPRIGVTSAAEMHLRFYVRTSPFVSGPKRLRQ